MQNLIQYQDENVTIYKDCIIKTSGNPIKDNTTKDNTTKDDQSMFYNIFDRLIVIIDKLCICAYNS